MKIWVTPAFTFFVLTCLLIVAAPSQASVIHVVVVDYEEETTEELKRKAQLTFSITATDEPNEFALVGDTKIVIDNFDTIVFAVDDADLSPFSGFYDRESEEFRFAIDRTSNFIQVIAFEDSLDYYDTRGDDTVNVFFNEVGTSITPPIAAAVPEPATLSLLALGVAGLVLVRRRAKLQLERVIPHGTNAANA